MRKTSKKSRSLRVLCSFFVLNRNFRFSRNGSVKLVEQREFVRAAFMDQFRLSIAADRREAAQRDRRAFQSLESRPTCRISNQNLFQFKIARLKSHSRKPYNQLNRNIVQNYFASSPECLDDRTPFAGLDGN